MPKYDFSLSGMKDPYKVDYVDAIGSKDAWALDEEDAVVIPDAASEQPITRGVSDQSVPSVQEAPQVEKPVDFQYTTPAISPGQAIFRSLLTMGITALGAGALGGSAGESLVAGFSAGGQLLGNDMMKTQRLQNAKALEAKGYSPESIDQWINTGNKADLVKDTTKWQSAGSGVIFDPTSGETKQIVKQKPVAVSEITYNKGDRTFTDKLDTEGNVVYSKSAPRAAKAARGGAGKSFKVDERLEGNKVIETYSDGSTRSRLANKSEIQGMGGSGTERKMTPTGEKEMNTSYAKADEYLRQAEKAENLANKVRDSKANWKSGVFGNAAEMYANLMGSQDEISDLKREHREIKNSAVLDNMPPGPASDSDVKIFSSGFPDDSWAPEMIESWLRGRSKVMQYRADEAQFTGDYIGTHGSLAAVDGKTFTQHKRERFAGDAKETPSTPQKGTNPKWPDAPPVGTVEDGHVYIGGDPSLEANWPKQQ